VQLSTEPDSVRYSELFHAMYGFLIDQLPDISPSVAKKEVNQ
jgi:hypothetical protein